MITITKIFLFINKNKTYILLILTILFLVCWLSQCNKSKKERAFYNQNVAYYTDSLRITFTKNKELEYNHAVLLSTKKDLEKNNKDLYDELQKEKGNVMIISIPKLVIKHDTIPFKVASKEYGNNVFGISWLLDTVFSKDNYRKLNGETKFKIDTNTNNVNPLQTKLYNDEMGISLVTGIKENKDKVLEIFIRSNYPGFTVSRLDGAIINPKKNDLLKSFFPTKKWGVGFMFGYGLGYANKFILSPYIGAGISYNIFNF